MKDDSETLVQPQSGAATSAGRSDRAPPSMGFAFAPSLPTMLRAPQQPSDLLSLQPGQQIDDFQVVTLLGRGGFGAVYLAWQISLGRQIALKISPQLGQEGRTLARLDHPHIVRVYSETVHLESRLLCMQYVASIALDELLQRLSVDSPRWTGGELLARIDAQHTVAAEFDPAQLADRQALATLDHIDAVCWIGSRLADALAHAHRHHVLHRDLKPGNILVSQYGRPMLVDFNLANVVHEPQTTASLFGGTMPYMSPEHLEAFDPSHPSNSQSVTEQSDIYSLGVVLFELLTGRLPFSTHHQGGTLSDRISRMVTERRQPQTMWQLPEWDAWKHEDALKTVLSRALDPDPAHRWKTADEFSRALADVLDLRATFRTVSQSSTIGRRLSARPFVFLAMVGLVPHFLGSLVNIPYNLLLVAGTERMATFGRLVNVYNIVVYPLCLALCFATVNPVFQWWRGRRIQQTDDERMAWLRRRVMAFPRIVVWIALLGWLPGAVWFPWGLNHGAGPLSWTEIFHLQASVVISGLIALTYSALGVSVMSIYVFYTKLWINPVNFRAVARDEVAPLLGLLKLIPFLAGAIPLCGAVLAVTTSRTTFAESESTFQILTTYLIVLGMCGFQLAVAVTGMIRQAVSAFVDRD